MRSTDPAIRAVVVNHSTSAWTELAARSLYAQHPDLDVALTIFDNASTDDADLQSLRAAAAELGVPVVESGFTTDLPGNSHGEVLSRFVLDPVNAGCEYFLFLDADMCFTQPHTVERLAAALAADPAAFGAGPRMSWDGEPLTPELLDQQLANPALYEARLHPCCALVRNTPLLRTAVAELGLSCAELLWGSGKRDYLDTFELMTRVLRTHGQHHLVVDDVVVLHAFGVSYPNEWENLLPAKQARRDEWLRRFRR
ncbi:glycosyltransferase family 2 protein [Flindersiella endophytica]